MSTSLFEFIRVDTFLDDMNRSDCFDTRDMDGVTPNYKIILVSDCASNVKDCIDDDGTLITPYDSTNNVGVNIIESENSDDGTLALTYNHGINGERTISVADATISYDFGIDTVGVKGAFLVNISNGSGYVLAYAINNKPVNMDGTFISPVDGMIWSIRYVQE